MEHVSKEMKEKLDKLCEEILIDFKSALNKKLGAIDEATPFEFVSLSLAMSGSITTMFMTAFIRALTIDRSQFEVIFDDWAETIKKGCLEEFKNAKNKKDDNDNIKVNINNG
jgi:hypothetical protein